MAAGHERERMKGETFFSAWPTDPETALCKHKSSCFHCTASWNIGQPSCEEVKQQEKREGCIGEGDEDKKDVRTKKKEEVWKIRALSKYRWR